MSDPKTPTPTPNIKVTFTHPRDSSSFEAEISPECTGKEALDGLVESTFLERLSAARAYSVKAAATGKAIAPSQTMASAGVKDGDTIAVLLSESGAARVFSSEA